MDPKSIAKSKRSHTQHGRRTHLPPPAIAHKKKTTTTTTRSSNRSLPSNWDRYDDEVEDSDVGTKQIRDGEVLPKSKGADFRFLLEQARSQPRDFSGSDWSKGSSSLDEFSFDFMQGVSSMLSVRGKSLLSLCENDNFIVDDDHKSSNEIPFLSMDLHVLAAQLSKLKLSQRLFIEEDLLPEELIAEDSKTLSTSKELEISEPSKIDHGFDSQALLNSLVPHNDANSQTFRNTVFGDGEKNLEAFKSSEQLEQSSRRKVEECNMQITKHSTRFEAAAVEAELDMLLDSFNNIDISSFGSIVSKSGQLTNKDPDYSRSVTTTSIDDLLAETSTCSRDQRQKVLQQKHTSFPENSPLYSTPANNSQAMSVSIDDMLAESTSIPLKEPEHPNQQKKGLVSLSKTLTPQTMDDFDSWLDTLDIS